MPEPEITGAARRVVTGLIAERDRSYGPGVTQFDNADHAEMRRRADHWKQYPCKPDIFEATYELVDDGEG